MNPNTINPGDLVFLRSADPDVLYGDGPNDEVTVDSADPMLVVGNFIHENCWPTNVFNLLVLVRQRLVYVMSDSVKLENLPC